MTYPPGGQPPGPYGPPPGWQPPQQPYQGQQPPPYMPPPYQQPAYLQQPPPYQQRPPYQQPPGSQFPAGPPRPSAGGGKGGVIIGIVLVLFVVGLISRAFGSDDDEGSRPGSGGGGGGDVNFTMPSVVGMELQFAQDLMQDNGVFYSTSHDLQGSRNQVVDSNWVVCTQNPAAGTQVTGSAEGVIDFGVVKRGEICP